MVVGDQGQGAGLADLDEPVLEVVGEDVGPSSFRFPLLSWSGRPLHGRVLVHDIGGVGHRGQGVGGVVRTWLRFPSPSSV